MARATNRENICHGGDPGISRRIWGLSCIAGFAIDRLAHRAPASNPSGNLTHATILKGLGYIIELQQSDGSWRSSRYSVLQREGELTAYVACLLSLQCLSYPGVSDVVSKAIRYLRELDFAAMELSYPVYTLSFLTLISTHHPSKKFPFGSADYLFKALEKYRYGTKNGWSEKDACFGGWGYEVIHPIKNPKAQAYFRGPNTSATLFGLMAYRNLGVAIDDNRIQEIYKFICRCQNMKSVIDMPGERGGFFFSPTDTLRNKAGQIGSNLNSKIFHSYGSATADGLRSLKLCGIDDDNPRVKAARWWLSRHYSENRHPGFFVDSREALRKAYAYYYHWSLASVFRDFGDYPSRVSAQMIKTLRERQSSDGSWKNTLLDGKEDDPLVATPMAVSSLVLLSS